MTLITTHKIPAAARANPSKALPCPIKEGHYPEHRKYGRPGAAAGDATVLPEWGLRDSGHKGEVDKGTVADANSILGSTWHKQPRYWENRHKHRTLHSCFPSFIACTVQSTGTDLPAPIRRN